MHTLVAPRRGQKVDFYISQPQFPASYADLHCVKHRRADLVRLAHAVGVPPAEAVAMFKQFNPGEMLPARAEKIASGPYDPPSFTVSMARKDARLMIEEAARHNVPLGVISAVAKLYDEAIARGEGGRDTTAAFRYPVA